MESDTFLSRLLSDAVVAEAKKIHEELEKEVEAATSSTQLEDIRGKIDSLLLDVRNELKEVLFPPRSCAYLDYRIRNHRRGEKRRLKMAAKDQSAIKDA